jgi:hypothetical protein
MKLKNKFLAFLFLVISIANYVFASENLEQSLQVDNDAKTEWITILVHGIISIKPHLNVSNVVKFVRDKIANTTYARSIEQTRRDPYFYQHHPMQDLGLHKIDLSKNEKGATASACAQLFEMINGHLKAPTKNSYYTFGWSGLLSPRMRYLEAKIFYDQILKELGSILLENKKIKLRIIGYSHGGNIALRLAEVYKREGYEKNKKIKIDEMILIGVPILPETDYLINSSIFKKVYHLYSYGDRVQRLDFFSLDRVFSNRKFHDRSNFAIPDKLVQINLKVKRAAISQKHHKKLEQSSIDALLHRRSNIRNADPGHTELWSFGWSPSSYRETFPFNPLPLVVFVPYIIEQIRNTMPEGKNLMVELHPHYEHMLLYNFEGKEERISPFLKKTELALLQNHAEKFRPDDYTTKKFDKKINKTIKIARKERLEEIKKQRSKNKMNTFNHQYAIYSTT